MSTTIKHIALIGDSIFDNAIYVPGEPAVIDHLRGFLPDGHSATLIAHDGDLTADVEGQLDLIPEGATHLVVSVGGNDALHSAEVLSVRVGSVADALIHLSGIRKKFRTAYRAMLWQVGSLNLPFAVCTIYEDVPGLTPELKTALALFNDSITREAMAVGAPIIDLRQVCTEPEDYSELSQIEPSMQGGGKIAKTIVRWMA